MTFIISLRERCVLLLFTLFFILAAITPASVFAKGAKPQEDGGGQAKPGPAQNIPTGPSKISIRGNYSFLNSGKGLFVFIFNKPMMDVAKVSPSTAISPEDFPVVFDPPIAGEGAWVSPTELRYTSYNAIPRATSFLMSLRPAFKGPNNEEITASFKTFTPLPFHASFQGQQRYTKDGTVTFRMYFSTRTDMAKLKQALTIKTEKGDSLPFEIAPDEVTRNSGSTDRYFTVMVKPPQLGNLVVGLPKDFKGEEGPVGLFSDFQHKFEATSMFGIRTVRARQTNSPPWDRYIRVETNNSVDIDAVRQYMEITPETDVKIGVDSSGFNIIGDFITRPRVSLTFKKGMPGLLGLLTEDYKSTIVFSDFSPRLALDTQGSILSPRRAMRVPLSTINVERVQTTLWELPENSIPLMAMGFFDNYKKHLSRKVAVRTGDVNGVRNRPVESSLDLTQIAGTKRGVFLLTVSDASDPKKVRSDEPRDPNEYEYDDDDSGAGQQERLVVISDIGITAKVMPETVTVWANSIANAEPIKNATARVYTANNILIAEGKTDNDGLWHYARKEVWGNRERPAIIVVSTPADKAAQGGTATPADIAYLKLDNDLTQDSAFNTGGREYLRQGYEAFCFTPRGVFRPGETVDVKILVRDGQMKTPEPFPVSWKVQSSTGRTVGQGTSMLSAQGGANFVLPLVPASPTGKYFVSVSLPGQGGKSIGSCTFSVEDFAPPRIEVKLNVDKPYLVGDETPSINIDAKYLFGTPVADAPWESSFAIRPLYFSHPDWATYSFPNTVTSIINTVEMTQSGDLDEKGQASLTQNLEKSWLKRAMNLIFTIRVREDGGRWVAKNISIPYFPDTVQLGYEFPKETPQAGSTYAMHIAAVTPDGKAASLEKVTAVAEQIQYYYVRSDRGYTQSSKVITVATSDVSLKDGMGTFTFTPPARGTYRVRVSYGEDKPYIQTAFNVWSGVAGSDDGGSPLIDRVMLSWDKPSYGIGETATLKVRSPFTGKLLIVLESGQEIYRQVLNLKSAETTVHVPILKAMVPNAYCSAWVVRPVKEGEVWGAHRAFGVIPLTVDLSPAKLDITLDAPKEVLPKGEMPVSLTLKNSQGMPVQGEVALAFVDEGLLSLTNYTTPDPFAFFTAKRSMRSTAYDLYDNLMPLSTRKPLTLQAGGGEGGDGSLLSPMTRKLELLSIFLGSVTTDKDGKATTTLKLPEYSGKGRLMAVAVSNSGVGKTDSQIRVARAITVEATVPRMVAPGDSFTAPVFVFASNAKPQKAIVTVVAEGPLSIAGQKEYPISLNAKTPKASIPLAITAGDSADMAALRIITKIEGSSDAPFEQRFEIPVRPPFPRLTKSDSGVVRAGESATIDFGKDFFKGTENITLSFADAPSVTLTKALGYLNEYPYGCLEQTVSRSWSYLAIPSMLKSLDPEMAADSQYTQAVDYAVRRILAMQRPDGGFNMWPGSSRGDAYPWGSAYATHFLIEAKKTGKVPADALKASMNWLRSYLASPLPERGEGSIMDALSTKAYIAYVLTLNGDAPLGWMQFLKEQGKFLSPSARIFLAGSYAIATGKATPLRELGTQPMMRGSRYGWSLESASRNEALRLLMWASVDPFAAETATLAARVIKDGNRNAWYSTQENGMAVMALGRYSEKTAKQAKNYTASVFTEKAAGTSPAEIKNFRNGDTPVLTRKDLFPASPAAPNPLKVTVTGEGATYYSWSNSGVPVKAPEPFSEGLFAGRRWIMPDGKVIDFMDFETDGTPKTAARTLSVPHGTKVVVSLYIKPKAGFNSLVLADIVPGGFEIDNPNLVPGSEDTASNPTPIDPATKKPVAHPKMFLNATSLNSYIEGRVEMRDDRLLLFVNEVPERPMVFTYTVRAVTKGTFMVPPLSAEAMYDPTIRSLSVPGKVTIE